MLIPYGDYEYTVTIHNAHLTTAREIHFTFSQRGYKIVDLSNPTVLDDEHCTFTISQQQTSTFFGDEPIEIQPNIVDGNGKRIPLEVKTIATAKQLLERIIGGANG